MPYVTFTGQPWDLYLTKLVYPNITERIIIGIKGIARPGMSETWLMISWRRWDPKNCCIKLAHKELLDSK